MALISYEHRPYPYYDPRQVFVCMGVYVCVYLWVYVCIGVQVCMYMYIYVYVCIYVCICMCVVYSVLACVGVYVYNVYVCIFI